MNIKLFATSLVTLITSFANAQIYSNGFENSFGDLTQIDTVGTESYSTSVPPVTQGTYAYQLTDLPTGSPTIQFATIETVMSSPSSSTFFDGMQEGNIISFDVTATGMTNWRQIQFSVFQTTGNKTTILDTVSFTNDGIPYGLTYTLTAGDAAFFDPLLPGATKFQFALQYDAGGALSNSFAIDNLKIVPEPGTYAFIFGIIAVATLVVRQRRQVA